MVDFSAPFNPLIAQNLQGGQNPLAMAGQMAQTQSALAGAQRATAEADDAQLSNAQNHLAFITSGMTPAFALGDNITKADVARLGANIVADSKGRVSADEISHFLVNELPDDGPGIQKALQMQNARLLSAQDRIATMRGQNVAISTGGGTQIGTRDSFTGAYRPQGSGGYIPNTMSPAEAAQPTAAPVDPTTGAQRTQTLGERAEQAGLAPTGQYTGRGTSNSTQVFGQPALGSPMAPAASGPIQTQPSPGQSIALKAGGEQYAMAGQNASTYGQQMQQLQSALTGLQGTTTGPGTESRQAIASYMLALPGGIGQYLPGVDPKSIQAYDEANKYLTQTAQGSPNATRSDAGLNTALASSPSVHISNAAAQDVLKANIGFRRAEMANFAAFQRSGQDPGQFQSFMAQRNQQIDPRAYSVDLLSPAQRASFMQSLSPAAKTKFLGSVRDAMASGMIDTSALSGGAGGR